MTIIQNIKIIKTQIDHPYIFFDKNVNILSKLNINFSNIIKITLHKGPKFKSDDNSVFQTLFSLNHIQNNLILK